MFPFEIQQLIFSFCDDSTKIIMDIAIPKMFDLGKLRHRNLSYYVAYDNNLEILKWVYEHKNIYGWYSMICTTAADDNNFDRLKWARQKDCKWDTHTCACASRNGNLEMLKWL